MPMLMAQLTDNCSLNPYIVESDYISGGRKVWVYVPETAGNPLDNHQKTYPVVYVLDGEHNFLCTVGVARALARASVMPQVIVVGVSGEHRELDYSPTDLGVDYMETGGGPTFLAFLTEELVPYVNRTYPSSNHNTLIGHSLGGLFSLYALVELAPFDGYLAISPSLWWDDEALAEDWLRELEGFFPVSPKSVFVTMANEQAMGRNGQSMHDQYLEYQRRLLGSQTFSAGFMNLFKEDHLSSVIPATHHGLAFLFRNWNLEPYFKERDFAGLKAALEMLSGMYHFQVAPDYASLVNMGRYFHNQQEFSKAIEVYALGLEHYPEGLQILGFAGQSYLASGFSAKARHCFEKGLQIAQSNQSPMISWFEQQLKGMK